MYYTFLILIFVVSVLLVLIVLIQNSKGGGLTSNFSSSNQFLGVKKTADFLEKTTWTLAIALFVFCLLAAASIPKAETTTDSGEVEEQLQQNAIDYQTPVIPTFDTDKPINTEPQPEGDTENTKEDNKDN